MAPKSNIERLGKIVHSLAPQLNELCPALDFPTREKAIAKNIEGQLREHGRVTLRNGAYTRHRLPVGVCFGFFGDVEEPNPPLRIQIPRERVSGREELLEQLQSLGIPRGWEQCNREPTDWTVIEANAPHDVRTDDEIANWVKARFNDLADHRLLMWIDANDRSPKADE